MHAVWIDCLIWRTELPFPLYDQATVDGLLTEDFAAAFSLSSELMGELLRCCIESLL
jgi:hypothetical protein